MTEEFGAEVTGSHTDAIADLKGKSVEEADQDGDVELTSPEEWSKNGKVRACDASHFSHCSKEYGFHVELNPMLSSLSFLSLLFKFALRRKTSCCACITRANVDSRVEYPACSFENPTDLPS